MKIVTNKLMNGFDVLGLVLERTMSTLWMKWILKLRGIQFGSSILFYGATKIKKASSARIIIGRNCSFRSNSTSNLIGINRPCILSALTSEAFLEIGDYCGFSGTVIGCFSKVKLGNGVRCGANTLITDSDWHLDDVRSSSPRPIFIHDNVWLGVNVTIMKGVTIGENSVIGAGSVVTKDIPANVVAAGNPCRVLKEL